MSFTITASGLADCSFPEEKQQKKKEKEKKRKRKKNVPIILHLGAVFLLNTALRDR